MNYAKSIMKKSSVHVLFEVSWYGTLGTCTIECPSLLIKFCESC